MQQYADGQICHLGVGVVRNILRNARHCEATRVFTVKQLKLVLLTAMAY